MGESDAAESTWSIGYYAVCVAIEVHFWQEGMGRSGSNRCPLVLREGGNFTGEVDFGMYTDEYRTQASAGFK